MARVLQGLAAPNGANHHVTCSTSQNCTSRDDGRQNRLVGHACGDGWSHRGTGHDRNDAVAEQTQRRWTRTARRMERKRLLLRHGVDALEDAAEENHRQLRAPAEPGRISGPLHTQQWIRRLGGASSRKNVGPVRPRNARTGLTHRCIRSSLPWKTRSF